LQATLEKYSEQPPLLLSDLKLMKNSNIFLEINPKIRSEKTQSDMNKNASTYEYVHVILCVHTTEQDCQKRGRWER